MASMDEGVATISVDLPNGTDLDTTEETTLEVLYRLQDIPEADVVYANVGSGMLSNPGVAAKMFESLYNEGVNINMISTSEIRITVLINEKDGIRAMNAVHDAFGLAD